ncbi:MAG TPA: hypothetical protein PLO67_01875 [Saprospiraceae bacterium]|nr:hypothetical protein [Saprospiraceae bacterium]
MENSFFILSDKDTPIKIERFHICTWEFNDNSSLIEFGFEIDKNSINSNKLSLSIHIPWVSKACEIKDLYERLSSSENSRFIFNDSIIGSDYLDGGMNKSGVIHRFSDRKNLCIVPVGINKDMEGIISLNVDLQHYFDLDPASKPNIYFRFWIKPNFSFISIRKKGISKSTIIYDIKINEKRNISDDMIKYFSNKYLCEIKSCFSFNILPNKYDIVFFDSASLRNVRTLEYESFNKYLGDRRVKKDELIVIFNKKDKLDSFSFFSIYSKERIGPGQFALAVLINIICGILLFIPAYRKTFIPEISLSQVWLKLPVEIFIAFGIIIISIIYFIWPTFTWPQKKYGNNSSL